MKKTAFKFLTILLALGLSSFNQTNNHTSVLVKYNGTHTVGELFGGGIVFNVVKGADGAEHGLIVSLNDLESSAGWSDNTRLETRAASSSNGAENTAAIIKAGAGKSSAAGLCDKYAEGGMSDWYLPASDEAKMLYAVMKDINKVLTGTKGAKEIEADFYWTSTETGRGSANGFDFGTGEVTSSNKLRTASVRAVRAF